MRAGRRALILVPALAVAALIWFSPLHAHCTRDEIRDLLESVRDAWYAPALLIALYAGGCVIAIPASVFIVASGAIWGWLAGGTFALAGGLLGAMASFFTARFFGNIVLDSRGPARAAIETKLRDAGFRTLLIARLLPVFPFAAINYGAGIVRVRPGTFFLSTLVGLVPSNYVFAWSADAIFNGSLSGRGVALRLAVVAAACIAAVVLPSFIARRLRRDPART